MRPGGPPDDPAARAARLLRWYPKAWRARYGDEFAELLIADITERPRSAARTLDIARGALAALPVLAAVAARIARGRGKGLIGPSTMLVAASTILFVGGRHFENGWPGTGGHRGLVPGGLAAFEGATSLSVSSYWAHPGALASFPAAELAWMAVSPLAAACAVTAATKLVRRAELPPRVLALETRLAAVACVVMAIFLAGSSCWVASSGGQPSLFHAGIIDVAGAGVLAVALAVAQQAARTAWLRIMEY